MTPRSNNPPSRSPAERLFDEHLARVERGEQGRGTRRRSEYGERP